MLDSRPCYAVARMTEKVFSDFYRASQIELFSALDNVLSQKAEDTLNQFAAVAEVNFQTSLGNRKGQLGINLIGAFADADADCRLPIADCRLPIADCRYCRLHCRLRLPIADCRVCGQVILVGLCHVFSFVLCQWLLPPTKAIIHKKTRMSSFFVKKFVIPAPAYAGAGCGGNQLAAGQRMLRRRKPPVTGRGFYIPVIPAQAGINSPQGSECCGGESRR